jgi:hypothetical protein
LGDILYRHFSGAHVLAEFGLLEPKIRASKEGFFGLWLSMNESRGRRRRLGFFVEFF